MESSENQNKPRKIIHVGVDCFYTAIETRDDPSLQGQTVVVAEDPARKGTVFSANYAAREHGIHATMLSSRAKQLCPKIMIILPEKKKYEKDSKRVFAVFHRYSELVEPLSLDEAYLDVTDSDQFKGDANQIAEEICTILRQEIGLPASAGVASNKLLAKIASDWKKPDGQFAITPNMVNDFIVEIPLKNIWELGSNIIKKAEEMNVITCGDMQMLSEKDLESHFGDSGKQLYFICRGMDDRPVVASKDRKSLSIEEIFPTDLQPCKEDTEETPGEENKDSSAETASVELDEEAQKLKKAHLALLNHIQSAKMTFLEFDEKKYQAILTNYELGVNLEFSASQPDVYLRMKVTEGDPVALRLITDKGTIIAFESELIEKRIPQVTVKFPQALSDKFVRNEARTPVKIATQVIAKKEDNASIREDITSKGVIINMSDTGCSFVTNVEMEKDSKIVLAVVITLKDGKKLFQLRGNIRRVKQLKGELFNYGMECSEQDRKTLIGIKKYTESHSHA